MKKSFPFFGLFRRKYDFVPTFVSQSGHIATASSKLLEMVSTTDVAEWKRLEKEIKHCEQQGNSVLSEFCEDLYETMMPSFNKTDLQALATLVDVFLDKINDCAKTIMLYTPSVFAPQVVELAECVKGCSDALTEMTRYMGDFKANIVRLTTLCDSIREIEHASDESFEDYIAYLFANEDNVKALLMYKDIAEVFEDAADRAKDVSDQVRKLLIRYI